MDTRQVGGAGYSQLTLILDKLNELLEKTDKLERRAEQNIDYVDFVSNDDGGVVDLEEDIIIQIEDFEVDEAITTAGGANNDTNMSSLSTAVKDGIVRRRTQQQLEKRKLTIGYHHGRLNPLPSSWTFPKGFTVIQLTNMWLLGNQKKHVPPMGMMEPEYIKHIDPKGRRYSKMKQVMAKIEEFGREDNVWRKASEWNGKHVTTLWSTIWPKLDPYLRTETQCNKNDKASKDKSRKGQMSWRSCYNKMQAQGLFEGNKVRKKRQKIN